MHLQTHFRLVLRSWLLKSIKLFQTILYEYMYKVRYNWIYSIWLNYLSKCTEIKRICAKHYFIIESHLFVIHIFTVNFQEFYVCPPFRGSQHSVGVDVYTDVSAPASSQVHSLPNHDAGTMVGVLYTQHSPTVNMYKNYLHQLYMYMNMYQIYKMHEHLSMYPV